MPYVGQKPADIISTAVDTVTGTFSGEVDAASLALSADASVGDDLSLVSDGSIVNFGVNSEISLTHVHNSGLTLASSVGATTFKIGRAGATDAKVIFDGNAQNYHIGVDDTNDSLVIGLGDTLGTTDSMVIDASGAVTKPLQPAFMVKHSDVQSNVANAATLTWDTEIFDQNADFASNTFTSPVTGRYHISYSLYFENIDNDATAVYIITKLSNREIYNIFDPQAYDLTLTNHTLNFSMLVDMDANDTAFLKFYQAGGTLGADKNTNSYFSGYLVA